MKENTISEDSKVTRQVKALDTRANNLSSTPGTKRAANKGTES